jgi:hypothetical protein
MQTRAALKQQLDIEVSTVQEGAVASEIDEEIDTMKAAEEYDRHYAVSTDVSSESQPAAKGEAKSRNNTEIFAKSLLNASEQVVTKSTLDAYKRFTSVFFSLVLRVNLACRLWKGFKKFCVEVGYATDGVFVAIEGGGTIPSDVPTWIAVWIMEKYL